MHCGICHPAQIEIMRDVKNMHDAKKIFVCFVSECEDLKESERSMSCIKLFAHHTLLKLHKLTTLN